MTARPQLPLIEVTPSVIEREYPAADLYIVIARNRASGYWRLRGDFLDEQIAREHGDLLSEAWGPVVIAHVAIPAVRGA